MGQKEATLPDGRTELSFTTHGVAGVKLWLYRFIPNMEVVAPEELKVEMKNDFLEAAKRM